jgi:hypothetical protein
MFKFQTSAKIIAHHDIMALPAVFRSGAEKNSPSGLLLSRAVPFPSSPSDSRTSQGSGISLQDGGVGLIVGRYDEQRTCFYRVDVHVLFQPFHLCVPLHPRVVTSGGLAK